jgi:hypothetical protein
MKQRSTAELSKIKAKWFLCKEEEEIMELVVKDTHFIFNTELGQRLSVIQLYPLGID